MSIQAQAGSVQAASGRGTAQLLAVFVFLVALFAGLVGLAIASRPTVAAPTTSATWSQTHPLMADRGAAASTPVILDRGADSFSGAPAISDTTKWSQTHPLMADRGLVAPVILDRGADSFSGVLKATRIYSQTHPLMADRGVVTPVILDRGADSFSGKLDATTVYSQSHPVMADRAISGLDMSAAAYAALHPVPSIVVPNVNAATGFNLNAGNGLDMSSAAYAALHPALSTPAINPYTGFDMSSAAYAALHPGLNPYTGFDTRSILDRGADR